MFEGTTSAIIIRTVINCTESMSCEMKWVGVFEGTTPAMIRADSRQIAMKQLWDEAVTCA
jgi:hypothetical protein